MQKKINRSLAEKVKKKIPPGGPTIAPTRTGGRWPFKKTIWEHRPTVIVDRTEGWWTSADVTVTKDWRGRVEVTVWQEIQFGDLRQKEFFDDIMEWLQL